MLLGQTMGVGRRLDEKGRRQRRGDLGRQLETLGESGDDGLVVRRRSGRHVAGGVEKPARSGTSAQGFGQLHGVGVFGDHDRVLELTQEEVEAGRPSLRHPKEVREETGLGEPGRGQAPLQGLPALGLALAQSDQDLAAPLQGGLALPQIGGFG